MEDDLDDIEIETQNSSSSEDSKLDDEFPEIDSEGTIIKQRRTRRRNIYSDTEHSPPPKKR
jgi:hypothetical protein